MIVENRLTQLDRDTAASALSSAYARLTGRAPNEKVLALLLAQSALETGHWKKIHNYNFGNVKAGTGYPLIAQFRCSEVDENGVEIFYDPPDPHCNFRAYESAADGAVDYLKVLQKRPHWWRGLHTEDPGAFVDALATPPKYFTANPEKYKRTLVALYERFLPLARAAVNSHRLNQDPAPVPLPSPAQVPSPLSPESTPAPVPGSDSSSSAQSPQGSSPPPSSVQSGAEASLGSHSPSDESDHAAHEVTLPSMPPPAVQARDESHHTRAWWLRAFTLVLRWVLRILRARSRVP
jgi:hypothetical protein